MRLAILLLALTFACGVSGCEAFLHRYDCRGTVFDAAGRPVAGAKVHVDDQGNEPAVCGDGTHLYYCWDEERFNSTTDNSGKFEGRCSGKIYTVWALLPPATPPPMSQVWVWFRRADGWVPVHVCLSDGQQEKITSDDSDYHLQTRHINLPQITLPPTTATVVHSSVGPISVKDSISKSSQGK